jgi:hypothetical protein
MLPRDPGSVAATAVIALAVAYPFAAMAGIVPIAQPLFGVCLAVAWILGVSWLAAQLNYWCSRRRGRRVLDRLDHESIRQRSLDHPAGPQPADELREPRRAGPVPDPRPGHQIHRHLRRSLRRRRHPHHPHASPGTESERNRRKDGSAPCAANASTTS